MISHIPYKYILQFAILCKISHASPRKYPCLVHSDEEIPWRNENRKNRAPGNVYFHCRKINRL